MIAENEAALDVTTKRISVCLFNRATYSRTKKIIVDMREDCRFDPEVILSGAILETDHEYIDRELKGVRLIKLKCGEYEKTNLGANQYIGDIVKMFSVHFEKEKPQVIIVVADRFETIGAAIAASVMCIPLIHIQGGETTGNVDEKIRHSITKLADYHFVSTDLSAKYVRRMGEENHRIWKTGCPSLDLIRSGGIKRPKRRGKRSRFIICQFHPDTNNQEEAFEQTKLVFENVFDYCSHFDQVCHWYWPNPDPGRKEIIKFLNENQKMYSRYIKRAENQTPFLFLEDLSRCEFIIGNSSCGIRESSYLKVPAINIGDRQGKRERSFNVVDCGFSFPEIQKAMCYQKEIGSYMRSELYGNGEASKNILRHLYNIDFETKRGITYPNSLEFKNEHFGGGRFEQHRKYKKNWAKY